MGFTDSLPLSLHLPLISQGSLKSDESTGCLSLPRGSESSNDLRLWADNAVCIDFYQCPWKQLQNTKYRIQNTDGLRPVSLTSRGITCFTFTTATTQASHPKRDQWKKSMAATVSGTMWISWISFGNAESHCCMQTARSGNRYVQIPTIVIPGYAINTLISRGRELNRCPTFPMCFSSESYRRTHVGSSLASD